MTDEQKALVERLRAKLERSQQIEAHGFDIAADDLRAILAERDAQAAKIARLRETLGRIARLEGVGGTDAELQCADMASAALAQETQP